MTRWDAARQQEWVEHHDGPVPDPPDGFWRLLGFMGGVLVGLAIVYVYAYVRTH